MKIYPTYKLVVGLLVSLLLLCIPSFIIANYESNTLTFFRAIEEKDAAASKNPSTYNRLSIKISNVRFKHYYVEQNPAHVVPRAAIEIVKVVKSEPEVDDSTQGKQTSSEQRFKKLPFYSINFRILSGAAKRFIAFVNKNKKSNFQIKVGDQSLGVVQFDWPFEIDKSGKLEFTIIPLENNLNAIKKILAPFENKVVWE